LRRPGQDRYPAGGPYTIGNAQLHVAVWTVAGAVAWSGKRYDTVVGSPINPPQV